MDSLNFYYLQRVLESELDLVETNTSTALKKARQDLGIVGMHDGGVVTQNAPPDLSVLVSGPALGTDPDGERLYWAAAQTVDCTQDHLGAPTTVVGAGNERWISVIAEYDQTLALPVTDGNGVTVYTRVYDSFNLYVTMATEQAFGANVKPALPSDGVLLADIRLVFGGVQILAADINIVAAGITNRRQDLVRYAGTSIPTADYGNLVDAVLALFGYVDALSTGVGVVFAATGAWRDASAIAAVTVSGAINEIVSDLQVDAGAARTGSAAHVTAGGFCDLANAALQTNLNTIADNVAGHINGGAPAHPATSITTAAIPGAPESEAGPSTVQAVLSDVFGHLNARTERASDEDISGAWMFSNGLTGNNRARAEENLLLTNAPWVNSLEGGSIPPKDDMTNVASGLYSGANAWCHSFSGYNSVNSTQIADMCTVFEPASGRRYIILLITDTCSIEVRRAENPNEGVTTIALAGLPAGAWIPDSCCSDGTNIYVLFHKDAGAATVHQVQAYNMDGSVKAGWLAFGLGTGSALAGTGYFGGGATPSLAASDRIKVVSMTSLGHATSRLAVACSWVPSVVGGLGASPCIQMLNLADGSTFANSAGCGDQPELATRYPCGGLASDGIRVFWSNYSVAGGTSYVSHCNIADATVDPGLTDFPFSNGGEECREIINDGTCLWTSNVDLNTHLTCYHLDREIKFLHSIPSCAPVHMTFDGLNIWLQELRDVDFAGTTFATQLLKIPCASARNHDSVSTDTWELSQLVSNLMTHEEVDTVVPDSEFFGHMMFDGADIWTILDNRLHGANLGGIVRKIPRAGMR